MLECAARLTHTQTIPDADYHAARAGDSDAFARLRGVLVPVLVSFAIRYKLKHEQLCDAHAETDLLLWQCLQSRAFPTVDEWRTWAVRYIRVAMCHRRANWRRQHGEVDLVSPGTLAGEVKVDIPSHEHGVDVASDFYVAMGKLPKRYAEALLAFTGGTLAQWAKRTNVSRCRAYQILDQARSALRDKLNGG